MRVQNLQSFVDFQHKCIFIFKKMKKLHIVHLQKHACNLSSQFWFTVLDFGEDAFSNHLLLLGGVCCRKHFGSQRESVGTSLLPMGMISWSTLRARGWRLYCCWSGSGRSTAALRRSWCSLRLSHILYFLWRTLDFPRSRVGSHAHHGIVRARHTRAESSR